VVKVRTRAKCHTDEAKTKPNNKTLLRRCTAPPDTSCQREECSPKSQGGDHYPEWEHCKLIGFAPDQETELFPQAVTGRSTKINVPLFNTFKRPPPQKKLPTTSHSDLTYFSLLEYLFLLQEVVLSLSLSLVFFPFSRAASKSKRLALFV